MVVGKQLLERTDNKEQAVLGELGLLDHQLLPFDLFLISANEA